jgi:hypothetical protein
VGYVYWVLHLAFSTPLQPSCIYSTAGQSTEVPIGVTKLYDVGYDYCALHLAFSTSLQTRCIYSTAGQSTEVTYGVTECI